MKDPIGGENQDLTSMTMARYLFMASVWEVFFRSFQAFLVSGRERSGREAGTSPPPHKGRAGTGGSKPF